MARVTGACFVFALEQPDRYTEAVVSSRQTLTQALLSDMMEPEFMDAAFSLYILIGFISIPFWTVASGHGL